MPSTQEVSQDGPDFYVQNISLEQANLYKADKSNQLENLNETVTLPENAVADPATFTVSLISLYGAVYSPILTPFHVSFAIGDATSTNYAFSSV